MPRLLSPMGLNRRARIRTEAGTAKAFGGFGTQMGNRIGRITRPHSHTRWNEGLGPGARWQSVEPERSNRVRQRGKWALHSTTDAAVGNKDGGEHFASDLRGFASNHLIKWRALVEVPPRILRQR